MLRENLTGLRDSFKTLGGSEGYALHPNLGIPTHHDRAAKGETVIDPTWDVPETCEYLGITFDREYLTYPLRYSGQLPARYEALRVDTFSWCAV